MVAEKLCSFCIENLQVKEKRKMASLSVKFHNKKIKKTFIKATYHETYRIQKCQMNWFKKAPQMLTYFKAEN